MFLVCACVSEVVYMKFKLSWVSCILSGNSPREPGLSVGAAQRPQAEVHWGSCPCAKERLCPWHWWPIPSCTPRTHRAWLFIRTKQIRTWTSQSSPGTSEGWQTPDQIPEKPPELDAALHKYQNVISFSSLPRFHPSLQIRSRNIADNSNLLPALSVLNRITGYKINEISIVYHSLSKIIIHFGQMAVCKTSLPYFESLSSTSLKN